MFGWEFPPHNSGGLGVACQGLVRALSDQGTETVFVLPKKVDCQSDCCEIIFGDDFCKIGGLKIKEINSLLSPYITSGAYNSLISRIKENNIYGQDLFNEVKRYGIAGGEIAAGENFDLIHAHDWLSFLAGLEAKKISKKPLVVQIHATEFDRTGGNNINRFVYKIEKEGMDKADKVIAVSNFTKNIIIENYGIDKEKIEVVYNAVEHSDFPTFNRELFNLKKDGRKIVLFVGRITLQKGPDYFLRAAKKVLERNRNVIFIIAGSGDMESQIIEEAAWLGIADKVLFAGFLRGDDLARIYQMADLYVLSSVSEPFGITPLEALANQTPVLVSKQSGVSEVIHHCLKVDFWDVNEMANKILAVLEYPQLHLSLKENGSQEVKNISWQDSARRCLEIYQDVLSGYSRA